MPLSGSYARSCCRAALVLQVRAHRILRPPLAVPHRRGCRQAGAGIPMVASLPSSPAATPSHPLKQGCRTRKRAEPRPSGMLRVYFSHHELLITPLIRSTAREVGESLLQAASSARPAAGVVRCCDCKAPGHQPIPVYELREWPSRARLRHAGPDLPRASYDSQ